MKKTLIYAAGAIGFMLAACQPSPQQVKDDSLMYIDVAGAMEDYERLKMSELGNHVRYVPLETNDSCLIGAYSEITVLDKQILVKSGNDLYCFDKETGRFLNSIGHVGDDPEGYSPYVIGMPYYNARNGCLYFVRHPNQLQKYDLQGRYQGKITLPTPPNMPTDYAFIDTLVVGYYNNLIQVNTHTRALAFFDEAGRLADTIGSQLPPPSFMGQKEVAETYAKPLGIVGAALYTRFQDGTAATNILGTLPLWKADGELRFKEIFNDTLYHIVTPGCVVPYAIFETGRWHFPAEARHEASGSDNKLLPTVVLESDSTLFFQCVRGLYEDEPEVLNGVYDKATGLTRMGKESQWFHNDLDKLMPFYPSTCSTQGEFAQIVSVNEVRKWLKKHPDTQENEAAAPLWQMNEEDNPVVILVSE